MKIILMMPMKKILLLLILVGTVCSQVRAESVIDGYNQTIKSRQHLAPLDGGLFGEAVSAMDGATVFHAMDVNVPTGGVLPIRIGRSLNISAQTNDNFGGRTSWAASPFGAFWNLDVPNMRGVFAAAYGWVGSGSSNGLATTNRCTQIGHGPPGVYGLGPFHLLYYNPDSFFPVCLSIFRVKAASNG